MTVVVEEGAFRIGSRRLHVDDVLIVRAGDLVPVDGVTLQGSGFVKQVSPSTWSEPRQILEGEPVWAGMEVVTGALALRARTASGDSLLARTADDMERLVASTDWVGGKIQRMVLSYLGCVALVCVGWMNLSSDWPMMAAFSFEHFISLLLVALPFGLSYGASSRSFQSLEELAVSGAFIPSMGALEDLGRREGVVLDIDGVLTCGTPELEGWVIGEGVSAEEAWHAITELASHEPTANLRVLRAFGQKTVQDANAGPSFGEVLPHGVTGRKVRDEGSGWALLESHDVLNEGGVLRDSTWGQLQFGKIGEPNTYGGASEQQVWYLLKEGEVIVRVHLVDPLRVEAKKFCASLSRLGYSPKVRHDGASSRAEHYAQVLSIGLEKAFSLGSKTPSTSDIRVSNEATAGERRAYDTISTIRYGRGLYGQPSGSFCTLECAWNCQCLRIRQAIGRPHDCERG